jgi:chromosomal replication initiation ATPase DnaA
MIRVDPKAISEILQPAELTQMIRDLAAFSGFTVEQLTGTDRTYPVVQVRQYGMYLARKAGFSRSEIGRAFGRRDHTTVNHGVAAAAMRLHEFHTDWVAAIPFKSRRQA